MYPNIRHRITLAMSRQRVDQIPYVFKIRDYSEGLGLAWAHFDLEVVVDIQDQLATDPKALISIFRRDQAALLHMFDQVQKWKDTRWPDEVFASLYVDEEAKASVKAKVYEIGAKLVEGLQRNHMVSTDIDKKCALCGNQSTLGDWHRDSGLLLGNVICQLCQELGQRERSEAKERKAKDDEEIKRNAKATDLALRELKAKARAERNKDQKKKKRAKDKEAKEKEAKEKEALEREDEDKPSEEYVPSCMRCKKGHHKCVREGGRVECNRCLTRGHQGCVPGPNRKK